MFRIKGDPAKVLGSAVARSTQPFGVFSLCMKRFIVTIGIIGLVATSAASQLQLQGPSWNGIRQRGKVKVAAGGSVWSVSGIPVSHTQELYGSHEVALYIWSRLKGKMHPASELAPKAGSLQFKVTLKNHGARIAWVCEKDLHYVEAKSYSDAVAFLQVWGFDSC